MQNLLLYLPAVNQPSSKPKIIEVSTAEAAFKKFLVASVCRGEVDAEIVADFFQLLPQLRRA